MARKPYEHKPLSGVFIDRDDDGVTHINSVEEVAAQIDAEWTGKKRVLTREQIMTRNRVLNAILSERFMTETSKRRIGRIFDDLALSCFAHMDPPCAAPGTEVNRG